MSTPSIVSMHDATCPSPVRARMLSPGGMQCSNWNSCPGGPTREGRRSTHYATARRKRPNSPSRIVALTYCDRCATAFANRFKLTIGAPTP